MRSFIIYFLWYYDLIGDLLGKKNCTCRRKRVSGTITCQVFNDTGYMVTILTRGKTAAIDQIEYIHWDGVR